jgi:hypothetical protein
MTDDRCDTVPTAFEDDDEYEDDGLQRRVEVDLVAE